MENLVNDKTKRQFFALYWDQEIGLGVNQQIDTLTGKLWKAQSAFTETLQLKPLNSISDEDALVGYRLLYPNDHYDKDYCIKEFKSWLDDEYGIGNIKHKWVCMNIQDFLRSKGYALPYRSISVEEMVENKWIKIWK